MGASRVRRERELVTTSDSVSSLNNPQPNRDPLRDLATVLLNGRCNSIPRSCTTDVLYRTGSQARPIIVDNKRQSVYLLHSKAVIDHSELGRDSKSVQGTLERVSQSSSKSLEDIINQAKLETDRDRQTSVQKSADTEEIYLDMSRLNRSSDYLEMERLQHHQNINSHSKN